MYFWWRFNTTTKELYVIGNPKIHICGGINTGCVSQAQNYSRRAQSIKQHCLLLLLHSMFIIMIVSNNLSGVIVPGTIFLCGSLDREALDKLALWLRISASCLVVPMVLGTAQCLVPGTQKIPVPVAILMPMNKRGKLLLLADLLWLKSQLQCAMICIRKAI